jgi:tetratricopeptide (TPR) repeat protein
MRSLAQTRHSCRGHFFTSAVAFTLVLLSGCRCSLFKTKSVETAAEAARGREERQKPVTTLAPAPVSDDIPLLGQQGRDEFGYPTQYVDKAALVSLLRAERYQQLTGLFEGFQTQFEDDFRNEYFIHDAANAFAISDATLLPRLDAWVAAAPDSFAPFLARGAHWVEVGFARRGAQWVNETHSDNLSAMAQALTAAVADLDRAIALRPKLVAAIGHKIEALMPGTLDGDLDAEAAQARALCKECFLVKVHHQLALRPRWGGSYEAMADALKGLPVRKNPKLKLLAGFALYDQAKVLSKREENSQALDTIDQACAFGNLARFALARAGILSDLGREAEAKEAASRAVALEPGWAYSEVTFAHLLFRQKDYVAAAEHLIRGIRIDPTLDEAKALYPPVVQSLIYAGWTAHESGDDERALDLLDMAIELDPKNTEALRRHTFIISPTPPSEADIVNLKKKAAESPDSFRAGQALDYALARQARFGEVVELWKNYIGRHPKDGRAYLEQSGAYWQLGQHDDARRQASEACALGMSAGCVRAQQRR